MKNVHWINILLILQGKWKMQPFITTCIVLLTVTFPQWVWNSKSIIKKLIESFSFLQDITLAVLSCDWLCWKTKLHDLVNVPRYELKYFITVSTKLCFFTSVFFAFPPDNEWENWHSPPKFGNILIKFKAGIKLFNAHYVHKSHRFSMRRSADNQKSVEICRSQIIVGIEMVFRNCSVLITNVVGKLTTCLDWLL